ncbi:hypothetical protein QUC26_17765 [Pseudomonas asiatica]|uniref:Uncharacterized protein n=1 Tax=Pseudomonas monteilii TaxID=76759 RepID=A0A7X3F1D7_9PSED|nr:MULTISPECIES: hypothetical protein [Pseudomonas]ANC80969.1 hypothetical protein KKK_08065 [Pseudomonas putida B6-2]KWW14151.1 hypothetical protein AS889_08750 [Pseudomonas putida]MBA6135323.1 hypothetical protein [Pseudomonas juntendi]MCA4076434.1 hypothetical protein [Pseudomonas kurunegalensis]MDM9589605.1 hypothetical protein [Pseudomonas asiatica]
MDVTVNSQVGSLELDELLATLKQVAEVSLDAGLEVKQLLFGGGDSLMPGLIDFRAIPASRTGHIALELNVTDRFRELAAALVAAHL